MIPLGITVVLYRSEEWLNGDMFSMTGNPDVDISEFTKFRFDSNTNDSRLDDVGVLIT